MAKKKKEGGLNKKLLHKMTESAMPVAVEPRPTLRLSGKEAKAMHGMKPGSKVKMMVHGRLMNVGLRDYGPEKGTHEASVEVHRIRMHGKVHGKAMRQNDRESPAEDQAEGQEEP